MENLNNSRSEAGRELSDDELIYRYCETYGIKSRGALVPHAPAVFIISRLEGIRGCAKYFSETLNTKVTKKQVEGILFKIRNKLVNVTEGDLRLAAQAHPRAMAYFRMYPAALSPMVKMEDEGELDEGELTGGNLAGGGVAVTPKEIKEAAKETAGQDALDGQDGGEARKPRSAVSSAGTSAPSNTPKSTSKASELARNFGQHFAAASRKLPVRP